MNTLTGAVFAMGAILGVIIWTAGISLLARGSGRMKKTRRSARSLWNWVAVSAMVAVMVMVINQQNGGT